MTYGGYLDWIRILYAQVPDCLCYRYLTPTGYPQTGVAIRKLLFFGAVFYLFIF
jgi:hypothetical protein